MATAMTAAPTRGRPPSRYAGLDGPACAPLQRDRHRGRPDSIRAEKGGGQRMPLPLRDRLELGVL